jgi:hypothetical protein
MVVMDEEESATELTTTRVSSRVLRPVLQIVHEHWAVMKILVAERWDCVCCTRAQRGLVLTFFVADLAKPWKTSWRAGFYREAQSLRRKC